MISGIHHASIISSSGSSVSFYEMLGFREHFRKNRAYDTVVIMNGHGIQLEIFVYPTHPPRSASPENTGIRYLSFEVDDFEEAIKVFDIKNGNLR